MLISLPSGIKPQTTASSRVAILSTYPPTQCGLATFTAPLQAHLRATGLVVDVVRVVESDEVHAGPEVVAHLVNGSASSALGVAAVIYPRLLTASALRGMEQGMALLQQSLASGEVVDRPDALVSFEELHAIMGMADIEDLEQRFLTPAQLEAKYGRGGESAPIAGAECQSPAIS